MKTSQETNEIFSELVKFRKKVVQPKKDANNPFFKSKYVMLEGVVLAIDTAIDGGDLKISYLQEVTSEGNQVSVSTHVIHESGQFITFDNLDLPVSKNDVQAFGSAITYAKRYSLAAAFGITSDVDDDGSDAKKGSPKKINSTKVSVARGKLEEFAQFQGGEPNKVYLQLSDYLKITSNIESLTEDEFGILMNYFNSKLNNKPKTEEKRAWD